MDSIKSVGLIISLLMVLMAYIKQLIPEGKINGVMKSILAIFILLSMIEGIRNFDLSKLHLIYENESKDDAWSESLDQIEDGLINEINSFLETQNISAKVINMAVDMNADTYEISRVTLNGYDAQVAKNLLVARYQINKENIEVKNE